MEGASIGHVCYMNGVPFGVLRAISDGANDDSHMDYPEFVKWQRQIQSRLYLNFKQHKRRKITVNKIKSFQVDHRKLGVEFMYQELM